MVQAFLTRCLAHPCREFQARLTIMKCEIYCDLWMIYTFLFVMIAREILICAWSKLVCVFVHLCTARCEAKNDVPCMCYTHVDTYLYVCIYMCVCVYIYISCIRAYTPYEVGLQEVHTCMYV
jgi:hypothetical protein